MQSNFIEITLRHGCSPVNLLYIFRTPLPKNPSARLLLELGLHIACLFQLPCLIQEWERIRNANVPSKHLLVWNVVKVNNKDTKNRSQWGCSDVFIVNFENISHPFLVLSIVHFEQVSVCFLYFYINSVIGGRHTKQTPVFKSFQSFCAVLAYSWKTLI